MDETFTKSEVDKIVEEKALDFRLKNICSSIKLINDGLIKAAEREENEKDALLKAIEEAGQDRRRREDELDSRIDICEEYNHKTFVKKSDLRIYFFIFLFAVTSTTGFITWIGSQNKQNEQPHNIVSNDEVFDVIMKIMKQSAIK